MQLIIELPDEFDDRVLEAFGNPDMNGPIHDAPYIPTTKAMVEERLKNYVRQTMYAYEDNRDVVQTMREREGNMVTTENGAKADAPDDAQDFEFSPAVKRAWESIEVGTRKTHLEELRDSRQDALIKSMSNVRTARTMLTLKEDEFEDRAGTVSTIERQAREAGVVRAKLELENALQECDALADELEALAEAIGDLKTAGERPMLGGSRATRRRNGR